MSGVNTPITDEMLDNIKRSFESNEYLIAITQERRNNYRLTNLEGYREGVVRTLNLLGIKISGVNAE